MTDDNRAGARRLPADFCNHFEKWMDAFEEFAEMRPEEVEELMRMAIENQPPEAPPMTDAIREAVAKGIARRYASGHSWNTLHVSQQRAALSDADEVLSVAENEIAMLVQHFGSNAEWIRAAREISAWGKANLPIAIYEALSTTCEGVLAMHRTMLAEPTEPPADATSEAGLRQMMRDPRYWRNPDPDFVARVREGFRRLYSDQSQ